MTSEERQYYLSQLEKLNLMSDIFSFGEISDLMEYFKNADPEDMAHGELSERVSYFKSSKGGQETMCTIMNEIRRDGVQQGIRQGVQLTAESMLKDGVATDLVAKYCQMSMEEVEALKKKLES